MENSGEIYHPNCGFLLPWVGSFGWCSEFTCYTPALPEARYSGFSKYFQPNYHWLKRERSLSTPREKGEEGEGESFESGMKKQFSIVMQSRGKIPQKGRTINAFEF